jgi:hypothetical protein
VLRRQVEQARHEPINQMWFAALVQLISAGMVLVHPGNAEGRRSARVDVRPAWLA